MPERILIVEDEETLRESLRRIFEKSGYVAESAPSAEEGLVMAGSAHYDVIITDIILPRMDGIEMVERIREQSPDQAVIVMTAYASLDTAVKALRAGAFDYIMKPVIHDELKQVVKNALRQRSLLIENLRLKRQIGGPCDLSDIIGESPALLNILEEVRKVADSKSNILLQGETGTGKELFAKVIHQNSGRKNASFIPINCSAIPENLLESELFGYVRGAFTGATSSRKGLLEEADGGTVFLDEIGELSSTLQVKLLRVLEDQDIRPLGSNKSSRIDIRLLTATNRDLDAATREGSFRQDLYYRINVINLLIPPLRERRSDIPLIARHYLDKYAREMGRKVRTISDGALELLCSYSWPGNIRELQNVIERAVLIAESESIEPENLPQSVTSSEESAAPPASASSTEAAALKSDDLSIEEYTKAFIQRNQGGMTEQELAEKLGITRKTLWEKRKKWGLKRPALPEVTNPEK